MEENKRVLLGMSGGTDSSVAAMRLLEAGYEVIGVTFRFYELNGSTEPTSEKRDELTYGGIKFGHSLMQDSRPIVWYMIVSNRDAVTARGIAVGDSLKKVMDIYGRPDFIDFNNRWFYGYLRYNSDNIVGIFFEHNGSKVTKIIISDN